MKTIFHITGRDGKAAEFEFEVYFPMRIVVGDSVDLESLIRIARTKLETNEIDYIIQDAPIQSVFEAGVGIDESGEFEQRIFLQE